MYRGGCRGCSITPYVASNSFPARTQIGPCWIESPKQVTPEAVGLAVGRVNGVRVTNCDHGCQDATGDDRPPGANERGNRAIYAGEGSDTGLTKE